jgi:hypothetical protein
MVSPKILLIVVLVLAGIAGAVLLLARAPQASTEAVAATAASRDTEPAEAATTALSGAQPQAAQAQTPAAPGQSTQQTPSDVAALSSAGPPRQVVATYFHNTVRCVTCRTIEQRARETIESAFAAELASGRLVWQVLNMEKKEYEHYATDYNLTSPSLVLALVEGDQVVRFAVLKDTWTLVHKKAEFEAYVVAETLAFLEEL